jgi:tetratricopeptide (TPR) repeat protein
MFDENAGSKQLSSRRSGRKFSTFAGRSHSRRPQDGDEISAVLYKFRNSLSMQEIGKGDSRNVSRTSESQNSNGKTAEAQHLPTPGFIFSTPNNNQKIKKRVFRRSKSYPGNKIYNGNMSQENSIPGNYFKKEDWLGKIRYWIDAEKPSRQRVHTLNRKQRNKSISKLYKIQYQGENARAETEKIPVISNHHHLAGNEAFRKKNYDRACAHYTQGINLFEKDVAGLSPQLAKLYSNRAAAYLALGRPIEASEDCERGIEHDSSYLKCWIRISTCYCCRGEFLKAREWLEKAQVQFQGNTTALNKISASHEEVASYEAKIHKILAYLGHNGDKKVSLSEEELHNALKDLEIVAKLFPNAEVVYWARAESLLRLMCLTEAQEVISTATNFVGATETYQAWKAWLLAQAYFFEGKINGTLVNLKALLEILITHSLRLEYKCMETPDKNEVQRLASALQKVEEARLRGKQAMKLQNYSFALEAYTTAIQVGVLSPVLASILYCNRAASHHGLSNYALALADCFMSRVLWLDNEKVNSCYKF